MTIRGFAVLGFCLCIAACEADRQTLTLLTPTELPAAPVGQSIADQLATSSLQINVIANDNAEEVVAALLSGAADLAIIEEPARRIEGLRTIVPLYPSILHVAYRADRDVADFDALLRGRHVYAGPIGGAAWRLLGQLAADAGLSATEYSILPDPWSIDPDVFFVVGDLLEPEALARFSGYRMYSFGSTEQLGYGTRAEALALKHPNVKPFILPEGTYAGFNPSPVLTLATRTLLVAGDKLDPDLAYLLARELIENAHDVASDYHLVMRELNERIDTTSLSLPLHRGARIYINKDEPSLLERYAEVVGVGLTIVALLVSAILALLRMSRARRKDRIDVFYRRVLEARRAVADSLDEEQCRHLETDVKAIQEEVLELLIAERLNVDESLTLFFDLSNKVLWEIARKSGSAA